MESHFLPYVFSRAEILAVLRHARDLPGPPLHALSLRLLILMLYCTGLRPGEAIRLRLAEVDLDVRSFLVRQSKGKTRLVPFRADLARELRSYRAKRPAGAGGDTFLVQPDGRPYTSMVVWSTLRGIFVRAGLKAPHGRAGPRPYDFRHAFAVHRLTSWYRTGANLHARLPWLSAYMGHDNLLGTETYLTATPELLGLASRRFEDHLRKAGAKR
jgi:integrase